MSLRDATFPLASGPPLPGAPPYPAVLLGPLADLDWELPPGDVRLRAVDRGGPEPVPAFANLVGAREAWDHHPLWMDFLDPASPVHEQKMLERGLYLHHWREQVAPGARVLDLGGGIGRFSTWCLDRGLEVELVDPDVRSLRRAVAHAAGRPGRFDVHWSTGESLPELAPVDVAFAVEVLNYVESPARVLAEVRRVLRPGGVLLLSVEARWGWPLATDVSPGSLGQVGGETLHLPGDRFVRTYDEPALRALLADWTVEAFVPTHYVLGGPFEAAAGPLDLASLLAAEARLRAHPVYAPLNRAWTVVAR